MKLWRINLTIPVAAFGCALLIAIQVASKTTRDAFFLSQFGVTALPAMVIVAAALSIIAGLVSARFNASLAPSRVLPRVFLAGAILLLMEWWISTWNPMLSAVLAYLQMTILGSILISGFWSLLDDRFDARSARREFGKIVAAGTLGGVIGGFLAARIGSGMGVTTMLPALALLHILSALLATKLTAKPQLSTNIGVNLPTRPSASGLSVLRTVPYVRNLARLILTSTMGAVLLDYVFKARVAAAYSDSDELVGFFALFYTTVGVATFLAQLILSRVAVDRLGIAGTVSSLPFSLALGSIGAILLPGLPTAFAMRGGEAMVRGSLFKSSYEMLYAAMPRRERLATKSLLDVGVERLGDLLGAVLLGAISFVMPVGSTTVVLAFAASLGLAGFSISRRLRAGYIQALENSLLTRSMSATQLSRLHTFGVSVVDTIRRVPAGEVLKRQATSGVLKPPSMKPAIPDSSFQLIQDLRSSDPEVVRNVLRRESSDIFLAPHVIGLLTWDEVSADAIAALKAMGPKITGQLVDALLDPDQEFAVRRRLARVLGELDSQRAVDGLIQALSDRRFEVRFHAARALSRIKTRNPHVVIQMDTITKVVEREVQVSPDCWNKRRAMNSECETIPTITVDHVFGLLELIYPRDPLHAAHRALRSGDDHLRRTSLEYLENVLPSSLWRRMLPLFEEGATLAAAV